MLPVYVTSLKDKAVAGPLREAIAASDGPVLAYCASGTRSTIIWMFGAAGTIPVPELLAIASRAGYPLAAYRQQLEAAARS